MNKGFVIINQHDRYFTGIDQETKRANFKKNIFKAYFFDKESEAAVQADFLKRRLKGKNGEPVVLKIAEVKFRINIKEYN